jgi:hypothetical protein
MKRLSFWYVYPDGLITDRSALRELGYVAMLSAQDFEEARDQALALGWIAKLEEARRND